jgi:hypothetical protein
MKDGNPFHVVLFDSTSAALLAEKLLKQGGIPHKVIPVPRDISSDCGVCIRFPSGQRAEVEAALAAGRVSFREIRAL